MRAAAIADTRPLFRLDLLTAFGAGVSATIAYESAVTFVSSFVTDVQDMRLVAALAFAPAVIGVVGVAVWRASFSTLSEGRRPPPTWPLALALTAGLMLGPELALVRFVDASNDTLLSELVDGRGVLWAIGLTAAIVLLLAWVRSGADAWLRAGAGRRPQLSAIVSLLAAAGVLTVVLGLFYLTRDTRQVIGISRFATDVQHQQIGQVTWGMPDWAYQLVMNPQIIWTVQRGELMFVLLLVLLVPLAAAYFRRPPARDDEERWAFLDPGGTLSIPPLARHLLRPLLVGIAAGAAFLIAELVLRAGLHYGMSADTRARDELILAFFAWQVALALIAQSVAGAVATAISGHRARVVDGLGAAFVTGSIAVVGIMGGPTAGGCVDPVSINPGPCSWDIPASFFWNTYRQVVVEGAVAALAAGLVTLGVLALVHLRAPAEDLTPAGAAG